MNRGSVLDLMRHDPPWPKKLGLWILLATGLMFMAPGLCPAQPEDRAWRQANPGNYPPAGGVMLWDSARQRVVRVNGTGLNVMYETGLDGHWTKTAPWPWPSGRSVNHPVYDSDRQRILIFGGPTPPWTYYNDTWEWDGVNWTQLNPAHAPEGRGGAAMAYDSKRKLVLLFGGVKNVWQVGEVLFNDTWQFDGTDWTQLQPVQSPRQQWSASMIYDPDRDRIMLYGGWVEGALTNIDEIWEWDGTDWIQRSPAQSPPTRSGYDILAYDSVHKRTLCYGGTQINKGVYTYLKDLWSWNGDTWTSLPATATPTDRAGGAIMYVPETDRLYLYGGSYKDHYTWELTDWWVWDGQTWRETCLGDNPPARQSMSLGYDAGHGKVVLFGGTIIPAKSVAETWVWDGRYWERKWPAHTPPERAGASMAWDGVSNKLLLFGGQEERHSTYYGDTWAWDGNDWTELHPAQSPQAQWFAGMAYDPVRQKVILNSGELTWGGTLNPETWAWDGTNWTKLAPALQPDKGRGTMFFDASRQELLLHFFNRYNQVYSWNGTNWSEIQTMIRPNIETGQAVAHSGRAGGFILFGGANSATWVWSPTGWSLFPLANPPTPRSGPAMIYDPARDAYLVYGGYGGSVFLQDTWVLENPNRVRHWENYR